MIAKVIVRRAPELGRGVYAAIARVHLVLVHAMDLIRQTEHGQAAGEHLIAQERKLPPLAALLGTPMKHRIEDTPVFIETSAQAVEKVFAPRRSADRHVAGQDNDIISFAQAVGLLRFFSAPADG